MTLLIDCLKKTPNSRRLHLLKSREFDSYEEELAFYKQHCHVLKYTLQQLKEAFDEYRAESRDYEEELEHGMETMETQVKDLRGTVGVLQLETEHWKVPVGR